MDETQNEREPADERGRLEQLREELARWRGKVDHLRVQANLGKRELRDALTDMGERLEPAQRRAREGLSQLAKSGASEARTLARSLQAGWDELLRTHSELAREARRERDEEQERRRQ